MRNSKKEPTWRWERVTVPWKTTQGELDEMTTSISSSPWYVDALLEELAKSLRRSQGNTITTSIRGVKQFVVC